MSKYIILIILVLGVIFGLSLFLKQPLETFKPVDVAPVVNNKDLPPQPAPSLNAEFGKAKMVDLYSTITFPDGLKVKLKEVNDSRCPQGVQCFWAGEVTVLFEISGGKLSKIEKVSLGTENNKTMTVQNYTFTFKDFILKPSIQTSVNILVESK